MKSRFLGVIILTIVTINFAIAQTSREDPTDFQGRYGVEINVDLPKKWEIGFDYQARYRNDLQSYRGSYFTISPQKEVFKNFTVLAAYRIALIEDATYHRATFGAAYKLKFQELSFGFRGLIQNQVEDFEEQDKPNNNDLFWRIRIGAQYPLHDKLDVYVSSEPIMKIGGIYFVDNWRQTVGIKWSVAKRTKLDFYYIFRPDYAKSYNRQFNIIGFNLDYTFKVKSKKKSS